jgi:hypothetical protein
VTGVTWLRFSLPESGSLYFMEDTGFWTHTLRPFDLLCNTRPGACESTHGNIWILPSYRRSI